MLCLDTLEQHSEVTDLAESECDLVSDLGSRSRLIAHCKLQGHVRKHLCFRPTVGTFHGHPTDGAI